jgi:ketosteroid isomerase-like protein
MAEMRSGALKVVLSYVEAAQQARRSQREDDWQRVAELLAEDVVWRFAGDGTGELWHGRRGRAEVLAALQVAQNTKEKPGSWTRRRAFEQVRHGSNIQLLSYSLVTGRGCRPRP